MIDYFVLFISEIFQLRMSGEFLREAFNGFG